MGSSFQNLVARTQNLGASGDRAPVRQQPCHVSVVCFNKSIYECIDLRQGRIYQIACLNFAISFVFFQSSLSRLVELLEEAQPFFVRCIRSNAEKVSRSLSIKARLHRRFLSRNSVQFLSR